MVSCGLDTDIERWAGRQMQAERGKRLLCKARKALYRCKSEIPELESCDRPPIKTHMAKESGFRRQRNFDLRLREIASPSMSNGEGARG